MARHNSIRSIAIAIAASSSLTIATVASAAPSRVSPLVALSALGTPQSAAAVSQAGIAKPQLAPSAAPYAMSTAAMAQADYDRDPNFLPLLIALGAMAVIVLIFHDEFFDEGGEIEIPIPISPD